MKHNLLNQIEFTLHPLDNRRLANFCGPHDLNLRHIEKRLGVEIRNRGHFFQIIVHSSGAIQGADTLLHQLYRETEHLSLLTLDHIHLAIQALQTEHNLPVAQEDADIRCKRQAVKARGPHQKNYIHNIQNHTLNFGIGPAGTGKTYLAVASAVSAFEAELVKRILLVRPAVEAGEHLGYLPGDFKQKVDPYFRPLYDAMYELQGFEYTNRLIEQQVIEIVPLAYMRGRTLNHSFIILDEAQNATKEQMKMFLTRIGFGSTVGVTGDVTQTDLPKGTHSGLNHAMEVLKGIPGVIFTCFDPKDIVRHPLVQAIVLAYEKNYKTDS